MRRISMFERMMGTASEKAFCPAHVQSRQTCSTGKTPASSTSALFPPRSTFSTKHNKDTPRRVQVLCVTRNLGSGYSMKPSGGLGFSLFKWVHSFVSFSQIGAIRGLPGKAQNGILRREGGFSPGSEPKTHRKSGRRSRPLGDWKGAWKNHQSLSEGWPRAL